MNVWIVTTEYRNWTRTVSAFRTKELADDAVLEIAAISTDYEGDDVAAAIASFQEHHDALWIDEVEVVG